MKPSLFYFGGDFLKKILLSFLLVSFLFFYPSHVYASNYTFFVEYTDGVSRQVLSITVNSFSAPVYVGYNVSNNTARLIIFSVVNFNFSRVTYDSSGSLTGNESWNNRTTQLGDYITGGIPCSSILSTNVPLFDNYQRPYFGPESLIRPVINSDGSITDFYPEFNPASDVHDFSKDVYDPDLSVPVLSNVSYTGFSIDNPDAKEWQVVVDGRVYGLKWNPSYTDPMILTNFNYTVNHQQWNFADHSDKLSLNGRFDVYDTFGISTYDWFVDQVKQYANDVHPSDYPNYSFLKVGMKTGWNTFLDYIKNIGSDEAEDPNGAGHRFEQNIYRSRMCQVTYYVRFVEYDSDGNPHYSRWMAYTLKPSQDVLVDGENFSRGNIEFGEVSDVDSVTGRPVVSEKENLKYNTDTGEYEYYDPLSNQNFQFEMNDVFGYISGLKESVMGFADLIAYCFSFLPSWVSQFISYSLVVAISFSVIRLIRG